MELRIKNNFFNKSRITFVLFQKMLKTLNPSKGWVSKRQQIYPYSYLCIKKFPVLLQ